MRVVVLSLALLIAAPVHARSSQPMSPGVGVALLVAGICAALAGGALVGYTVWARDHAASAPTLEEFQHRRDVAGYGFFSAPLLVMGAIITTAGAIAVARPRPPRRVEVGLAGLRVRF